MESNAHIPAGSVVVGYDGSDHSEYALRWAADEADLDGRSLTILTVVQSLTGYELSALANIAGAWNPPTEIREAIHRHAQEQLETVRAKLHQSMPDLPVQTVLREGDARQVLLELSQDAASIFLGSRGRGPVASLLLGSVSVAVSRAAECPVFVIRPPVSGSERRGVLVGTDCREQTRPTLEFAYRQAAIRDLPLTVLYCVGGVGTSSGIGAVLDGEAPDGDGYDDERRELAEVIAGMSEKFPEVKAQAQIGHGTVASCLIQESRSMDLIVVGHHTGPGIGDLVGLGSFVAPIVENAMCPVAIVVDRNTATG